MKRCHASSAYVATAALRLGLFVLSTASASAHCDALDGPVVRAAEQALASGDVNHVFVWVQKPGEEEVRRAFNKTIAVRKHSADAKELADRSFTGLKPAGQDYGPAIPAADRALESEPSSRSFSC